MTARMAAAAGALVLFALTGSASQDPISEVPPPPTPAAEKGTPPASLGTPVPLPPAPAFTAPAQPGPAQPPDRQGRRLFKGRLRNRIKSILNLGG
jgi:hypothetical protein